MSVRKGYYKSHALWVTKDDITSNGIAKFNGATIISSAKMLATVPVAKHPSSHGYEIVKRMSTMIKQKRFLKDWVCGPSRPRIGAEKSDPKSNTTSILMASDTMSSTTPESNSKESKKYQEGIQKVDGNISLDITGEII